MRPRAPRLLLSALTQARAVACSGHAPMAVQRV
jgi:hypothetical protein